MRRLDHQLYNECVQLYFKRELAKLKSELSKGRLSQFEKNLLWSRLHNLDGNYEKAIENLLNRSTTSKYLDAQRYNVLSSVYDKVSLYQKAATCNHKAIVFYQELEDQEGLYISYLNLSINYSRLSLRELFDYAWNKAYSYKDNKYQIISLVRSKASYLSKEGNLNEALSLLLDNNKDNYFKTKQSQIVYMNLIADVYFRLRRYDKSFEIYKNLHSKVKSITRERVQYEYQVTKSLMNKSKLVAIPESFSKTSEYFYLWSTLLSMQDGEPDMAKSYWNKLLKLNPDKYLQDYEYKDFGDINCHFLQFYEFLRSDKNLSRPSPFRINSKANRLYKILRDSETALRKEVLIERVWRVQYDPDLDSRFYKLIQRLKIHPEVSILMKNSTYQLVS